MPKTKQAVGSPASENNCFLLGPYVKIKAVTPNISSFIAETRPRPILMVSQQPCTTHSMADREHVLLLPEDMFYQEIRAEFLLKVGIKGAAEADKKFKQRYTRDELQAFRDSDNTGT